MAKRGTLSDPKTIELSDLLNCEPWAALGLLEALWDYACDHATDGAIGRIKDSVIADGVKWKKKPSKLIDVLIESGWLKKHSDPEIRFVISGWVEHAQDLVRKKLERAGKTFWDGTPPRAMVSIRKSAQTQGNLSKEPDMARRHLDGGEAVSHPDRDGIATTSPETDEMSAGNKDEAGGVSGQHRDRVETRTRVAHPIPSNPIQKKQELPSKVVGDEEKTGGSQAIIFPEKMPRGLEQPAESGRTGKQRQWIQDFSQRFGRPPKLPDEIPKSLGGKLESDSLDDVETLTLIDNRTRTDSDGGEPCTR